MREPTELIRGAMRPLVPVPTGIAPKLARFREVEAVVFDLYGTLLISSAGGAVPVTKAPSIPLQEDGAGITGDPAFAAVYREVLGKHQEKRRAEGIDFPEVEIRAVWAEVAGRLGYGTLPASAIEDLALRHECLVNPVWPMPRARETLEAVGASGRRLGILSNAQFYTTPALEGLLGASLDDLGFDPRLRVFSYEALVGKPSLRLYGIMRDRLAGLGIPPERVFFLGNDYVKDILPARATGFRTGLFAGDARSLRLGGTDETEAVSVADAVITDLAQVPDLFD